MISASRILIIGATARAAAWSARRAGFEVEAGDQFGDLDLRAVARFDPGAHEAARSGLIAARPDRAILYTGPLENEPAALHALEAGGTLLGNSARIVRPIRDPFHLARVLRRARISTPELTRNARSAPTNGTWLLKHPRSSGGVSVHDFRGQSLGDGWYLQRRIGGRRRSALYLGDPRGATLLGLAAGWTGAAGRRYLYRGGIAPLPITPPLRSTLERIGQVVHEVFQLRGLFGVDLIVRDKVPWVLEVNPRYTASVELYEHAMGRALIRDHARAFGVEPPEDAPRPQPRRPPCVGKLIVYARRAILWSTPQALRPSPDPWRLPRHADIPPPGTRFRPGDPVLTLLQSGPNPAAVARRLHRRFTRWRRRLDALAETTA